MKNNKRTTVISTIAATAIIVSVFAFNSNAFESKNRAIEVNKSAKSSTSNVTSANTDNKQTSASAALATALEAIKQADNTNDKRNTSKNTKDVSTEGNKKVLQTVSRKISASNGTNVNTSVSKNSSNSKVGISNNQKTNNNSLTQKYNEILNTYYCNQTITNKSTSNKGSTSTSTKNSTTSKTSTDTKKPASNTTSAASGTTSGDYSAFQKKVVELVNAERAKAGLKPLKMNTELNKVATTKSQDMAKNNYFSHTSPTYGSPFDMMKKFGISYKTAGENIAMGQTTPEQVMNGWMNSSGHRANILKASFTEIGVGIAKNSSGRLYWTQQFIG